MKERPILFSGEMVRAILEGRKTQTRRALNRNKLYNGYAFDDPRIARGCPYGQAGDRLWVRETWAHDCPHCDDHKCGNPDHIWYRASESPIVAESFAGSAHLRPSIFMPRWASRLTLEIVGVRVERIQDISEEDAIAEGCKYTVAGDGYPWDMPARMNFVALWDDINAERGYGWGVDPWVWVIQFRRAER